MKIQYEVGDRVYLAGDYGGESFEIVALRTHGAVIESSDGQRSFAGKHQMEPAPDTVQRAKKVCG